MRLRGVFRLCFPLMRDIIIDLPIEGHHPPDRAHGDILSGQETPEAELSSIGMGFLEVIHLDQNREPHLPRGLRARLVAQEASKVLGFKAVVDTPDEFGARIKLEIEKWSEAVRNAKLRID